MADEARDTYQRALEAQTRRRLGEVRRRDYAARGTARADAGAALISVSSRQCGQLQTLAVNSWQFSRTVRQSGIVTTARTASARCGSLFRAPSNGIEQWRHARAAETRAVRAASRQRLRAMPDGCVMQRSRSASSARRARRAATSSNAPRDQIADGLMTRARLDAQSDHWRTCGCRSRPLQPAVPGLLPKRTTSWLPREDIVQFEEIERCRSVPVLGVEKVRLTGGEPLLRRDLPALIERSHARPIRDLAMTTNAVLLKPATTI